MYLTNQRIDFSGRAKRVVLNSGRSMKINSVSCLCLREHIKLSFPVIMNTAYAQQPPLKPTPLVVVGTTFFSQISQPDFWLFMKPISCQVS